MIIAFVITCIVVISIYLLVEYRYYVLYFFDMIKNKFKYLNDLNRLMNKDLAKKYLKDDDIKKYIDFLYKEFKGKGILLKINKKDLFIVPDDLKRKLIYSRYDDKSIKELVYKILEYLRVDPKGIEVETEYKSSKIKTGIAGLYYYDTHKIKVFVDPNYSYENIVSITAHECMHHFLTKNKIKLKDEIDNETITDFSLIMLGFSKYIIDGYKEKRRVIYETENKRLVDTNKIGYLAYKDILFAEKYIKKLNKGEKI